MKYPVLLPNIFDHPFTYESSLILKTGDYVNVPFGRKIITGVVWNQFEKNDNKKFEIKLIKKKLNIESLKKQEELKGFKEAPENSNKFFNLGPENNWQKLLDTQIKEDIEESFQKEMSELGYL